MQEHWKFGTSKAGEQISKNILGELCQIFELFKGQKIVEKFKKCWCFSKKKIIPSSMAKFVLKIFKIRAGMYHRQKVVSIHGFVLVLAL